MSLRSPIRSPLRRALRRPSERAPAGASGLLNALRFAGAFGRVGQNVGWPGLITQPFVSLTSVGTAATAAVKSTVAMYVGMVVQVAGVTPAAYNGHVVITSIIDGAQFTYTCASAPGSAGSGGTVAISAVPNAARTRVDCGSTVTSSGTTATVTISQSAPLVGDQFFVVGASNAAFNGIVTVATSTPNTSFTFTLPSDQGGASATGCIFYPVTALFDAVAVEIADVLGSGDWSELRVSLPMWAVGSVAGTQGLAGASGGFTIDECAIAVNGTAYAPVKFGGSLTKVVNLNSGASHIISDAVVASDFIGTGVTLTRGTPIVIRAKITLHGFNSQMVGKTKGQAGGGTTTPRILSYNKARTSLYSVSTAYSASAFTISGTGTAGNHNGIAYYVDNATQPLPAFNVLGRPVSNATKSFLAIGDSITQQSNDSANTDNTGATVANAAAGRLAWFSRSLWDTGFTLASATAGMNCAIVGTQPIMYVNAYQGAATSWFTDWMDYCTHFVDADGTNGFGGTNKTAYESLWASAKAKGKTVIRTSLFPRTTTTDSYATTANQTPYVVGGLAWGVGSGLDTQEGLWKTQTTDHATYPNGPDYYLQFVSIRASGGSDRTQADYWKWAVNGAANYATTDGLHPSPGMHVAMAAEARALWATV